MEIKRVLMTIQNRGKGTPEDVIRSVMFFYDEKTLDLICEYDPVIYRLGEEALNRKLLKGNKP